MKVLSRSKMLLVAAIAFTMLLFSGLVVGGRIREASGKLETQREELAAERDRLRKISDARADYESQTRRFDEAFAEMTARYPAGITQNSQILFLRDVEDEFGLQITSVSYTEPEAVYRFQYLSPGNEESYQLIRSTLQFPMSLSYGEWKRFITYIEETNGREVIESVSADYNENESLVDVDVTILQYAITGSDRKDAEPAITIDAGTDNIFSSGVHFYTGDDADYSTDYSSGYGAGYSGGYSAGEGAEQDVREEDGSGEPDEERPESSDDEAGDEGEEESAGESQTVSTGGTTEISSGIRGSIR